MVEEVDFQSGVTGLKDLESESLFESLQSNETKTYNESNPQRESVEEELKYLLPSEIEWKNYNYYSPASVSEDNVRMKGGRWTLFAFKELDKLDHRWSVLQKLCDNGTLAAIKSSTATYPEDCLTICYTSDSTNEGEVKKAGEEIRKLTDYKYTMCYKANNPSADRDSGVKEIYLYVHTAGGVFYRKEINYLLPTEVDWKNRICYYSTSIDKNILKERGGKWILHNDGDKTKLNHRWIALKSLCDLGTLVGIESSTATENLREVTVCYTLDSENREDVRKAADKIRELINYEKIMNYIACKSSSKTGQYRISGSTEICKYIHTVASGFYEKDKYMRWIRL